MMPHVYTTEGTAAIVSTMEETRSQHARLSMNHIDTECGKQMYETFVLRKASCLKYLKLSGNEISHDLVKAFKEEKFVKADACLPKMLHHKVLLTLSKKMAILRTFLR